MENHNKKIIKGFNELSNAKYHHLNKLLDNAIYQFENNDALGGTRVSKVGLKNGLNDY